MSTSPIALRTAALAVVAAALALIAVRATVLVVVVDGDSMLPTYRDGDRLLVRSGRRARRGDVVVVRAPDPAWTADRPLAESSVQVVKRVSAVGGEPRPDGSGLVPADCVYVEGDAAGYDSRTFGPLPRSQVRGRVLRRL